MLASKPGYGRRRDILHIGVRDIDSLGTEDPVPQVSSPLDLFIAGSNVRIGLESREIQLSKNMHTFHSHDKTISLT